MRFNINADCINQVSLTLISLDGCTYQPTYRSIGVSWTCQDYVEKGLGMDKYCTKDAWIANKNCGQTCAKFGLETDPNCGETKNFFCCKN